MTRRSPKITDGGKSFRASAGAFHKPFGDAYICCSPGRPANALRLRTAMLLIDYDELVTLELCAKVEKPHCLDVWLNIPLHEAIGMVMSRPISQQAHALIIYTGGPLEIAAIETIFHRPDFPRRNAAAG